MIVVPDQPLILDPWLVPPDPPAWGSPPLAGPEAPDWHPGWTVPYIPEQPDQSIGRDAPERRRYPPSSSHAVTAEPAWPVQGAGERLVTFGATGLAVAATGLLFLGLLRRRF
ncbi:hypothetical protein [Luedemannella helvata]|uniref:Uncharacterized protein n=1 Tax=Luedemannella helvata TaxID=349315 RepID=A0ABN2KH19_9ACTN